MGSYADKATKDKAMAAHLKQRGVRRTVQRCPLDHRHLIPTGGSVAQHLSTCAMGKRSA